MARFMIVDDSMFQRKSLEKLVRLIGGEVVAEASNGRESVEMYPVVRPDVVLMDIVMPEMDGAEASRRILELDSNAKILLISSVGYESLVKEALSIGVRRFIMKPVDFDTAISAIRSVMEGA